MSCAKGCCDSPAEHYRSLVMSGSSSVQKQAQRREDADLNAYKRLRAQGYQPPSHVGAAALEKAAYTPHEIETGRLTHNRKLAEQIQKVADIAKDPQTFTPITGDAS